LAVFGHPIAHEDDVSRAVFAGLEITRQVARLSEQSKRRFGVEITARVGVHRGLVYLDTAQDDVYGLGANLAARVSGLAQPGTVVISDAVAPLVRNGFDLEARPAAAVKGIQGVIAHHRVLGERAEPARLDRSPLVGRDRELGPLAELWARAQTGTLAPAGVVFRGEPGIGKSRLAAAAGELVEPSGAVVLELVGSPLHTDAGLYPVRILLERRCGIDRGTDQAERLRLLQAEVRACGLDAVSVVPLLAPVLRIGPAHGYEPVPAEGRKLYDLIQQAVHDYLLACVGHRAGLVIADDAHWFDASTMEIVGSLLEAAHGRLLVVVTGRPGDWLPAAWPVKVFDIKPLTEQQSEALIRALNPGLTGQDRAAVATRCDGVPFYIEQVVNGLSETGVPEALYEPLFARLRARANVVPVVEAAAIIGRQLDRGLLCSVVDLSDDEVDDVIDELEDALVLEPSGIKGWRFRHELLREVAAELAPPSVLRQLHSRVADALIGVGGDPDWRLVADHYQQAGRFLEAASAYQRASSAARSRGALAEARSFLTLGIAGLERCRPGQDRDRREMALRFRRGFLTVAVEGYHSRAAAADFERYLRLSGIDLRADEPVWALDALAGYYTARADLSRAVQVLESLRAGIDWGRWWLYGAIEALLGEVVWLRGDFEAAGSHLEHVTAGLTAEDDHKIADFRFGPLAPIGVALEHVALTHLLHGDLAGAEAGLAQAARRVEGLAFPMGANTLASVRCIETWVRMEAHQLDRATILGVEMSTQAELHGLDMWLLITATQQACVRAMASLSAEDVDPTELTAHITTVSDFLDTWRALGLNHYRTIYDALLGRLLIAAGRPEEARDRLDTALTLARNTEMHFYDAELLRLRAQTHAEPGARQADITSALEMSRRQGATLFELRAALDDFELRGQPARAALIHVSSRIPTDSPLPELARTRAALNRTDPQLT
ncbi:MAG: adenylate cyclase, partial [Mycobacterium sp.]|nr:adenylate cyclase [Mycobacterium sp.]